MIDTFTKAEFENALPIHRTTGKKLWVSKGIRNGEEVYTLPIDDKTAIEIRSSVKSDGVCASTGKDSIRMWLTDTSGAPLGSKVNRYTTRVPGWEGRMTETLRTLYKWRKKAGNCPMCGEPKKVFLVKKEGPNKGRVFSQCPDHKNFTWLT